MDFKKSLNTAKLILGGTSALGATGYGSYHIGKHIATKNLIQQFNNQQIATDAYNRGLQEGQVEKTAQIVAQELLEKEAGMKDIAKMLAGKAKGAAGYISGKAKGGAGSVKSFIEKHPKASVATVAGATGVGAGYAASKLMEKKSSDVFEEIRQNAYNEELQKLGFSMTPVIGAAKKAGTWIKGMAQKGYQAAKGPISQGYRYAKANPGSAAAIGGAGAAVGAAGAAGIGAMTSKK